MNPPTIRTQANAFQQFLEAQSMGLVLTNDTAPRFINLVHMDTGMRLHVPTEVFPFITPGDRILVTLACVKAVLAVDAASPLAPPPIPLLGGPKIIGGN